MVSFSVCYIMHIFYSSISCFINHALESPLLTLVLSFIVALIIIGHVHLSKLLCNTGCSSCVTYDYGPDRGPHTWPVPGPNQSPINIETSLVEFWGIHEHVMWNHYNDLPTKVTLENTGQTVVLRAKYAANSPTLSGADLLQSYTFESLCFHWSFWNNEGSEHAINFRKYPLEIQATHKTGPSLSCVPNHDSLITSYLFEIATHNVFLDPIILNLHRITRPGSLVQIPPFPLAWLCYPFKSGFYSYGGSRTYPPCQEGVEWFICSEPLTISESQLAEFRLLLASDGSKIIRNSRPIQCLNNHRTVHFNQYQSGRSCSTSCAPHLSDVSVNEDDC